MTRPPASLRIASLACLLCVLLAGCAKYHAQPLPTAPDLARAPALTVPAKQFLLPRLAPHPIPARGLDQTTVVMLAVFNDPILKAARLQAGIARAQMLQAGLLPDPVLTAAFATSARNYGGALGLMQDLQSLITRRAAKAAAAQTKKQVHLNILWQEWQVAAQASQLFIQARSEHQLLRTLQSNASLLHRRYHAELAAMRNGDQTSTIVSADLSQWLDAQTSLHNLQSSANVTWHQLDQLLGLQPGIRLHLVGSTSQPAITTAQFHAAVAVLPHRRADLLALQAGYQSQQQSLRKAVLAQFPNLSAGVQLARDPVEGINSLGPQVNLTLPIFNRNRGRIAIQRATRAYLRQIYQSRLDTAISQAHQVWRANRILASQLHQLESQLPQLRRRAAAAKQSLQQDNLDQSAYVAMQSSYLTKRAQAIRLRASLNAARSALRILLGLPLNTK